MALTEYRRKRNFQVTDEPKAVAKSSGRSIFCVQKHAASHLHYDFRLELDGVLLSWAVPKGPSLNPANKRLAMHVEDHPLDYAEFEGTIPQGEYGGGTVVLWDFGAWQPEGNPQQAYRAGNLKFTLHGQKLTGHWHLVRRGGRSGDDKHWFLFKSKDDVADTGVEIVETHPLSVKTGRSLKEVAAGKPARKRNRLSSRVSAAKRSTSAPGKRKKATKTAATTQSAGSRRAAKSSRTARAKKSSTAVPVTAGRTAPREKSRRKRPPNDSEGGPARSPPVGENGSRNGNALKLAFEPQLATLADRVPTGEGWLHEQKFDGYRMLCLVDHGQVLFISRTGNDWTDKFGSVAAAVKLLRYKQVIFDGEIAALDPTGVTRFQALQTSFSERRTDHLKYYVFDLLFHNGQDFRDLPLLQRKAKLAKLLAKVPAGGVVQYSQHRIGAGEESYRRACRNGEEGIISKRADRPYRSGRSPDWLKIKCTLNQEFVIGGYTDPQGDRTDFGALLVGYYDHDQLKYAGKVGTGFSQKTLSTLSLQLKAIQQSTSPFADLTPRMPEGRKAHWVQPTLVAQLEFTQWTDDGRLRHPSFQGLREDKRPETVVREQPLPPRAIEQPANVRSMGTASNDQTPPENGAMSKTKPVKKTARRSSKSPKGTGREKPVASRTSGKGQETEVLGVRLTSPGKVLYAEQQITKLDLAQYYEQVAEWMLPHIEARPLSLVRCPEGTGKACFFQKHLGAGMPTELREVPIKEGKGTANYVVAEQAEDLIALAQIGALELHCWGSRADKVEYPDQLVFDLDPAPDVGWPAVIAAARGIRELLEGLGLNSLLKTTGGKGLHLVVPIQRRHTWDEVKAFCKAVADAVAAADPQNFTANMSKKARTGKIFLDYLRNGRGATAIAPYSTRSRPGAPVSMPIDWDELNPKLKSDSFTIANASKRLNHLKSDPWADFNALKKGISRAAWKSLGQDPPDA